MIGCPGTGKTTYLIDLVSRIYDENSFYLLTFSRAAAKEAMTKFYQRVEATDTLKSRFRTIHSLCMEMLGVKRRQIMTIKDYANVMANIGLPITTAKKGQATVGNHLVEYVNRRELSFKAPVWCPVPEEMLANYEAELAKYKKNSGKFSFTDLLKEAERKLSAGEIKIDIDYICIDELQDLSLLQWKIVEHLVSGSKHAYLVGDADQTIYTFAGADSAPMLELAAKGYTVETLPQSRRIPVKVHHYSQKVIGKVKDRLKPEYLPTRNSGFISTLSGLPELSRTINKVTGSWFILGRTNYIIEKAQNLMRSSIKGRDDIKFMTIHQSKGLEADNVAVLTELPKKVILNMELDNEYRLFYVAITRTKKRLVLVNPDDDSPYFVLEGGEYEKEIDA